MVRKGTRNNITAVVSNGILLTAHNCSNNNNITSNSSCRNNNQ